MRRRCRINTNAKSGKQSFKTQSFASLCKIYTPCADKKTINFASFSILLTPPTWIEESKNKFFFSLGMIIQRCFEKANLVKRKRGRINYIFDDLLTLFFLRSLLFSYFFFVGICVSNFFFSLQDSSLTCLEYFLKGFTFQVCLFSKLHNRS